jgi:hypothetical protein
MTVTALLGKIATYIINPIIVLGFVVATIIFFFGIAKFIYKADSDSDRETGKKSIVYGIVGLFIMISVYGILRLVLNTFDIPIPSFFP